MMDSKKLRTVKAKNKKLIVKQAKKLFIEKGIEATTITDIAKAIKMERKTIYNHFKTKDLIAEYIFIQSLEAISFTGSDSIDFSTANNGLEKVEIILRHHIDTLFKMKDDVIYTVHYDYYFRKNANTDYVSNILDIHQYDEVLKYIKLGVKDGSVNLKEEDVIPTFNIIGLALMSYFSRLVFRGHIIEKEMGISESSVYDLLDILLKGI